MPTKKIPEPADAYRNARFYYLWVAFLLASWELIGISLEAKANWGFEIESSSKLMPLILFITVMYCRYRMTTKWMLCNSDCKTRLGAKWNPRTAHAFALIAIAIAIIQYLFHTQIADYIAHHQIQAFVVAAAVTTASGALAVDSMHTLEHIDPKILKWLLLGAIGQAVSSGIGAFGRQNLSLLFATFPWIIGSLVIYRNHKKAKTASQELRP